MRIPRLGISAAAVFLLSQATFAYANEKYLLAPGDHIAVKVSDFRAGTGESYQWAAFSAENVDFIVGPDGWVSLPVVGQFDAEDKTTSELEEAIATKLQGKAGLTTKPDVSVQIVKFRPFYVVGAVDKPGEYDYRPGLTVIQAVGIAGGAPKLTTDAMVGFMRDAINARGDLRMLAADRISFIARQARLDAEIAGWPSLEFPDAFRGSKDDPDVARAWREESLLFEADKNALDGRVAVLQQTQTYLRSEIESLKTKIDTINEQLASTRKEYDLVTGLVHKGLASVPRQLELEQNLAQIENNRLDAQVAIIRANEDIAKAERDILDLKTTSRNDALREEADVRVKLAETIERIATSQALVVQAEVRGPAMTATSIEAYDQSSYALSRRANNGKVETIAAQENDPVRPGDVVRVIPQVNPETSSVLPTIGGVTR
jgi:protein involved in polysaccharide export with SLBB domain